VNHGGRGSYVGLGLNVARLFSKKFVLGFIVEFKGWKGLWPDNFTNQFQNDFNWYYQNSIALPEDSARAETLHSLINGSPSYSVRGTFYSSIGICFSPFPYSHGGILVNVKKGGIGIPVHGTYGSLFNRDGNDWVSFSTNMNYRAEIVCKPLLFFPSLAKEHLAQSLQLSFFVQEIDWTKSNFDGLFLQSFLAPEFFSRYNKEYQFGITAKFGFY